MIQINNLSSKISANRAEINAAIGKVIESGWLVLGPEVKRFENAFAEYLGVQNCISVANGTDAIELALRALGIGRGCRVATVANAGMYTTTALLATGAEPFFLDVDICTRNTTLVEVERALSAGVNAVVITHLYGLATPEISEISEFCRKRGVPLLEDCAQAHGASVGGKALGSFGDAASFSFYPTKNLGALGDGGAVVTNNSVVSEKVSRLRQYGWSEKYTVEVPCARNSRLDELQASILLGFLPKLDANNGRRRDIADRYANKIKNFNVEAPNHSGSDYVAHLYVIRIKKRDELRRHLKTLGISSDIHYPIPDYRQPVFGNKYERIALLNTELLASEVLTLPCYPEMTDMDVERVIDAINCWIPDK